MSFANLLSFRKSSNKKGGTDSFINNDEEGLKVKMTKEQMQQAEEAELEALKVQLRANGMDEQEIENEINRMKDAEKPKDEKQQNGEESDEEINISADNHVVNGANSATHLRNKSKNGVKVEDVDF